MAMHDLYNNFNADVGGLFPNRSKFSHSHKFMFSGHIGKLYPTYVEEVIPGDTFEIQVQNLTRFMPLVAPQGWDFNLKTVFFFVPNRLVWSNWESFITGSANGQPTANNVPLTPVYPWFPLKHAKETQGSTYYPDTRKPGDIYDFIYGGKCDFTPSSAIVTGDKYTKVSALPLRAYNKIYNDWFKNEPTDTDLPVYTSDGNDGSHWADYEIRNAKYEKDYFTAANLWTQKGGNVVIPLVNPDVKIPVKTAKDDLIVPTADTSHPQYPVHFGSYFTKDASADVKLSNFEFVKKNASDKSAMMYGLDSGTEAASGGLTPVLPTNLYVDQLSSALTASINDLRNAFQRQKFLERDARAGNRYIESILSHFGVRISDYKLQRSEYLGGFKQSINTTTIYQTSSTASTSPQGNQVGIMTSLGASDVIKKSFEEHGWIIGITFIVPRTGYYQGVHKRFTRFTREEHYFPEYANLGEQAILNKEIYADGSSNDDGVFGYIGRYDEMRQRQSRIAGQMRYSLEYWQYARKFATLPTLGQQFVEYSGDKRIFAVTSATDDEVYFEQNYIITATRPMPLINEPGLIDHH